MNSTANNFIEVAYELFAPNETGNWDLVEKTSKEHPFCFITGLGFTLESFEKNIALLRAGDKFDFTVPVEEAYGEYTDEHVIRLKKQVFNVNGKFDEARIYPGNVVPLANADGNRFDAIVKEVCDDVVVMDLNHPLAGKPLHFRGHIVTARPADNKEIQKFVNEMNGEEDCGSCGHEGHCREEHGGSCSHDGHCREEHGENCGHHGHCHEEHGGSCGHEGCGCRHNDNKQNAK